MKRLICAMLVACLMLAMTACGGEKDSSQQDMTIIGEESCSQQNQENQESVPSDEIMTEYEQIPLDEIQEGENG